MTPTDEAAALIARVLAAEAPYLSRRGRAALSEALALLEVEEPEPVEYVPADYGPDYERWRERREYRRRR
jgi:hypothetical protein